MNKVDFQLQRCANHWKREAAARCPGCHQYFCRECVTEHEDRVYCTVCLEKILRPAGKKKRGFDSLMRVVPLLLSFMILWLFFFNLGQALLMLPDSFHEGTIWKDGLAK